MHSRSAIRSTRCGQRHLPDQNDQYVPVYGGNYYLNTSWRVRQMYQTHEDCNSARTLYTHYTIIGYAYMIVDFVDLNTMQPLGKIIVELNIDKLLSTAVAEPALPFHCRHFQRCSGQTHRLSADRPVPRERGYEQIGIMRPAHSEKAVERVDIYIPNAEILAGVRQSTRVYFLVCAAILILALLLAATCLILLLRPLRQMLHTIGSIGSGGIPCAWMKRHTPKRPLSRMPSTTWPTGWTPCFRRSISVVCCCATQRFISWRARFNPLHL